MTNKNYTTIEKIQSYLGITITDDLEDIIKSTQKYIENFTSRNFKADDEANIRYFSGNDTQNLPIDDCVEITKVEVGNNMYGDTFTEIEEENTASGYYLHPVNYNSDENNPTPIRAIHLRNRIWLAGIRNQRITGKWGYSVSVPDDISLASTLLCSIIYKYGLSSALEGVKGEKIGDYSVTLNETNTLDKNSWSDFQKAKEILTKYKKLFL